MKKILANLGRLNHVAIATPNIAKSANMYRSLGCTVSGEEHLPEHGVTTVFVDFPNTKIELITPFGEKSPIENFLKKNPKGGIHHICFEVDDLKASLEVVKQNNITPLNEQPKIGAHGKPVVFLHPKDMDGVLVELEES